MKTTIELPDELFREAKATAARRGKSLKAFFEEALEEKLTRNESPTATLRETAPKYPTATETDEGEVWPITPLSPPLSSEDRRLFDAAIEEFETIDAGDESL